MPDWRRNVLSSSETFIDALSVAARAQKIEQERLLEVTQTKNNVSSFPRRNCNKYNQQMICPYTTVFLGSPDVNGQNGVDSKFLTDATMDIKHVDVYSLDRSSNVTHTSSFAHYQNRSLTPDYEISNPKEFRLCQSDYCLDGRVTLQIQKVPYTTSVFYVSARNEFSEDETIPSSELYLIDTASDISDGHVISDAISTCTCDSFERTSFDCKDFEPFSDTCCCEPCDGVCSRSPKDLESPDHLLGLGDTCRKGTKLHGEDGVSLSNRSDMEGLDLTIFEPAENNCVEMGSYEMMGGVGNVAAYRIEMENSACNEDVNSHMFLVSQEETSANGESLGPAGDTLSGLLHVAVDVNDNPRSPIKGAAGPPSLWEPHYCVLQQERRTLTAYTSEELAHRNSTGAGKRVRLDGGGLRCWAAPPSIAEEDVDERDDDFTSLNAYVTTPTDTSYEKACRRGSAPSSPAPGAPPPGHSPSRLAAFFFSKRSFRGGNPLKRTKSATKLERERAMLAAAGQPGAAHSALHALRTSRSHESLLSAHSPAVSTMDLGPPHEVEIRALHASVLGRPHCFALSAEGRAPRYFACASRRECDRWIYSLKQAARPGEMRGRRTERSLRLWVQEAKALPPKKRYYCEITLDDTLYARTSSKLKTEMCFWGEVFEFASLPAVRNVCINVYREPDRKPRKHTKHTLVGTVKIPVDDVSSRYLSERWYPVVPEGSEKSSPGSGSGQTPAERTPPPSLRVKCRYQVTDVLPIDAYAGFLDYLKRNYKKVCEYLEPVIGVKAKEDIGCALVLAMQGVGRAPRFLADVVALDVRRTGDHSLTFRGNSLATKSMEAYLKVVGDQYLQETLGEAVSLAAAAGAECEVDPARGGGGGGGGALRRRQAALRQAVEVTWARVADSAQRFPPDLRECFATFRERLTAMGREDISDNLISASIFLRFLCPAILSPSLFGITHEFPSERAARNLTLIAKTLQTLANFTRFQGKEAFMEFLNDFLEKEAPRMKTFLREISTRAPSSQRNSDPSASSVSEEQAGQSWAPHADMGRQLAVLHGLLADCLTKLPPGRVQELDPLPEILEELSRRQSCPDGGALPSAELADNIFRFNDPTCNNKVGESLPTPNFAHSSPLPAQNPNENKYADKNTYATISKSPSFNTRAATLPRNGYPPSVNPDRYSSQYNNQEHCVNLKVIQIGLDATPYAKTPLIKQVNGRNSNLDSNTPQIVTNDKRNECFNNKMNNFNQQNFYNNHNRTYGTVNDNYYPDNVQSLRKETANLDELSDLLKYADDQDIDVVEEKLNVRKNNLTQSHSNNNVTGGLKSHNYGNTNGSNMSISGNSNVASSGYQSFATYSQSSSPIEPQTNHVAYDNNNGQPLSRYSQMNNYNKQRERFYDGKSERIYPTKNATQQKIEYDLQKYGIQNFTTDDGSQPIKNGSTTNLAPLVFTNPVYSMENGVMTNRPMEKDCIRNAKKYGDVTKKPNKRCGCGSSSSSMDEEGMTTDNPETNSEEGAPNFANSETRHENGSYDRLNNLQNKTLSYDRNSNRTSSSAESNYSHRKLTRDIYGYEPDYITKQGVEINNEEADYKRNYKQDNDSPNNSPSIRKVGKTRMPRTNPSLSYSNNQNQLNLKHFGQRGDAIYETINNNGNNDNYTTNNRSESNVEEVNKEMYRLQISRSQQAIYNGTDNRQALMNALHNSPRSDKNYNLERNYSAVNVPNETNYILERNYSASNVSSTRLNDELNSQEGSRYGKCCNELRQSPSSAKVRLGLGLDLGTGEKVKEKLQRRLSLESARELTDSSSDMEDIHYSTTGRRRTKGNHRTIEQYEREIERLQCSVELLRQKLEGAGDASDHDHSSDTKMKAIISRLICVEEELRREQRKMSLALSHKQRVIEAQEHRIAALDAANTRLLSALTNLQQRAPPAPPAPSAAHGVPPTPPHEVQI